MNFVRAVMTASFIAALTLTSVAATAASRIELDVWGETGDYPAVGPWGKLRTDVVTDADGSFMARLPYFGNPNYDNSLSIDFFASDWSRWISLQFSTDQLGVPLVPGFYDNAQRFPFNMPNHAGLDYSDTGFGFNTLEGSFQVQDIQRVGSGADQVTSFAASFTIYNYPAPGGQPLLTGRVWFNSDATLIQAVPEPSSWAMLAAGLAALALAGRRHSGRKHATTPSIA